MKVVNLIGFLMAVMRLNGSKCSSVILVEDARVCFQRALAGQRISPRCVLRRLFCERLEDCRRECALEKRFVCEGFNYRLDRSGRGQGVCELTEVPLSRLSYGRDYFPDKDYDYYERDRNSYPDCSGTRPLGRPWHLGNLVPTDHGRPGYPGGYEHRTRYDDHPGYRPPKPYGYDAGYDRKPHGPYRPYPGSWGAYGGQYGGPHKHHRDDDRYIYWGFNKHGDSSGPRYPSDRFDYGDLGGGRNRGWDNYWGVSGWGYGRGGSGTRIGPGQDIGGGWRRYSVGGGADYGSRHGGYGYKGFPFTGLGSYGGYLPEDRPRLPPPPPPSRGHGGHYGGERPGGEYGGGHGGRPGGGYGGGHRVVPYGGGHGVVPHDGGHGVVPYCGGHGVVPHDGGHGVVPYGGGHGVVPYGGGHGHGGPGAGFPSRGACVVHAASGVKLHRSAARDSCYATDFAECERRCRDEVRFKCCSFSYGPAMYAPIPNCFISERGFDALDAYHDLEPDRAHDVFTVIGDEGDCSPRRIWPDTRVGANNIGESECFVRVRSGQRLAWAATRDAVTASSVGQCELACVRARHFHCKTFTYRYGPPLIGHSSENCLLSDCPFYELIPGINLLEDPGFELYERGSPNTGCHLATPTVIPLYPPKPVEPAFAEKVCYLSYDSEAKLVRQSVRKAMFLSSELDCKARCSSLRKSGSLKCMSYSFRLVSAPGDRSPNCLLSDIDQRDLRAGLDYEHVSGHRLFAWDLRDERCRRAAFDAGGGSGPPENRGGGDGHGGQVAPWSRSHEPDPWQQYSVSGWPCRRDGAGCQHNVISGHYACELEGAESTSWDYCCAPDHRCGYSEGFDYAWCYVGPNKSQWRKCADRYFPYGVPTQPTNGNHDRPYPPRNPAPPGGDHDHHGHRPPPIVPQVPPCCGEQVQHDGLHDGPDQIFLSPPSPGGFVQGRYWPVAYLHSETPPSNVTYAPKPMDELPQINREKTNDTAVTDSAKAVGTLVDALKTNDLGDSTASTVGKRGSGSLKRKSKPEDVIEFEIVDNISIVTGNEDKKASENIKEAPKNATNKVRKSIRYW